MMGWMGWMRWTSRRGRWTRDVIVPVLAAACLGVGCTEPEAAPETSVVEPAAPMPDPSGPPGARWDIVRMLRAGRAQPHHASDGRGQARLVASEPSPLVAGGTGRFTIDFEVDPAGVAAGGMIFLQVSPFWGWSTPQVTRPTAPGYTTIEPAADDMRIEAETVDRQLLGIRNTGRPLVGGDRLRIVYGAGPARARVDRYAERDATLWVAVDGDGDGVRAVVPDSPHVDIVAAPPRHLLLTGPTVARPGEPIRLTVAVLDAAGNAGAPTSGPVTLDEPPPGVTVETPLVLDTADQGRGHMTITAAETGILRLRAHGPDGVTAESNPIVVSPRAPRVLWADLHGHSHLSDGTGTPDDYFAYARDVAGLDVAALTDHDHWGVQKLDTEPALWRDIQASVARFHAPGRFVALLGYEWTSWIYGHRHVLYFEDAGEVLSSVDPRYESPRQLWQALAGRQALTFAHHSAGGPIPTDWTIAPDPVLEPVTEVTSVHGSSEAPDTPGRIYQSVAGNFVRDALGRGYRLGFVGSGDSHDGHPGLAHLAAPSGGLAAIITEDATRSSVLAALRARRTYATNGPRILLQVALDGHPMGSRISPPADGTLVARVVAPRPLTHVDVVRTGKVAATYRIDAPDGALQHSLPDLATGEYVYVRAVQTDGGAAWSSPIFIE